MRSSQKRRGGIRKLAPAANDQLFGDPEGRLDRPAGLAEIARSRRTLARERRGDLRSGVWSAGSARLRAAGSASDPGRRNRATSPDAPCTTRQEHDGGLAGCGNRRADQRALRVVARAVEGKAVHTRGGGFAFRAANFDEVEAGSLPVAAGVQGASSPLSLTVIGGSSRLRSYCSRPMAVIRAQSSVTNRASFGGNFLGSAFAARRWQGTRPEGTDSSSRHPACLALAHRPAGDARVEAAFIADARQAVHA